MRSAVNFKEPTKKRKKKKTPAKAYQVDVLSPEVFFKRAFKTLDFTDVGASNYFVAAHRYLHRYNAALSMVCVEPTEVLIEDLDNAIKRGTTPEIYYSGITLDFLQPSEVLSLLAKSTQEEYKVGIGPNMDIYDVKKLTKILKEKMDIRSPKGYLKRVQRELLSPVISKLLKLKELAMFRRQLGAKFYSYLMSFSGQVRGEDYILSEVVDHMLASYTDLSDVRFWETLFGAVKEQYYMNIKIPKKHSLAKSYLKIFTLDLTVFDVSKKGFYSVVSDSWFDVPVHNNKVMLSIGNTKYLNTSSYPNECDEDIIKKDFSMFSAHSNTILLDLKSFSTKMIRRGSKLSNAQSRQELVKLALENFPKVIVSCNVHNYPILSSGIYLQSYYCVNPIDGTFFYEISTDKYSTIDGRKTRRSSVFSKSHKETVVKQVFREQIARLKFIVNPEISTLHERYNQIYNESNLEVVVDSVIIRNKDKKVQEKDELEDPGFDQIMRPALIEDREFKEVDNSTWENKEESVDQEESLRVSTITVAPQQSGEPTPTVDSKTDFDDSFSTSQQVTTHFTPTIVDENSPSSMGDESQSDEQQTPVNSQNPDSGDVSSEDESEYCDPYDSAGVTRSVSESSGETGSDSGSSSY